MDQLREIGAILGFVAFAGLAVLVFMTFQQARHLRRLRDWAGRSPERAQADAERVSTTAAEAAAAEGQERETPGRLDHLRGEIAFRYEELDRRSPVSPAILFAGLLALVVAAGILTSGFGFLGSSEEPAGGNNAARGAGDGGGQQEDRPVQVAVLNGTAPAPGEVGVEGIASTASGFVRDLDGFRVGEVADAGSYPASVVMFEEGSKSDARELAQALEPTLGSLGTELMTPDVQGVAGNAELALVVGLDDQALSG